MIKEVKIQIPQSNDKHYDQKSFGAVHAMAKFLTDFVKIPLNDAGMLMSLAGELKFCQVVDPEKTVQFEFPKSVLEQYGYKM